MSLWQRIKDIPPFVASIIAIAGTIIGILSWLAGYYATKTELQKVECLMVLQDKLQAYQSEQIHYYTLFGDQKNTKIRLEGLASRTPEEKVQLEEATLSMKDAWADRKTSGDKAKKILSVIKSGKIFDGDGNCVGHQHAL